MNQVVMVCYYFPPLSGIASERAAAFVRHLPGAGWEPVVVAPGRGHFHTTGQDSPPGCRLIRTRNPELSRGLRSAYSAGVGGEPPSPEVVLPVSAGPVGSALRSLVRELVYLPDAQLLWIPFARWAALGVLEEPSGRPTVVYSTSVPYSAHLAAGSAARRAGVPWVAEFRDPWTTHDEALLPRTGLRRGIDRRIEDWILRTADHVVVTADAARDLFLTSFPFLRPEGVSVVRNGFESLSPGRPPGPQEPLTLVHAGTLHDPEYARPVVEAVARLHGHTPGALRLVVYGDPSPWKALLEPLGWAAAPWMELRGVVDPEAAREAVRNASALLLPAPHPGFRRIVLGKLLTYLGARRPILGVVPSGSEMEEVIRRAADGRMVRPWEAAGVLKALEGLLEDHRAGRLQEPRVEASRTADFTREAQTRRLAAVFEAVAAAPRLRG